MNEFVSLLIVISIIIQVSIFFQVSKVAKARNKRNCNIESLERIKCITNVPVANGDPAIIVRFEQNDESYKAIDELLEMAHNIDLSDCEHPVLNMITMINDELYSQQLNIGDCVVKYENGVILGISKDVYDMRYSK